MLLVPINSFSLTGRLCSGEKRFDWANVIFAAYFILRGRDSHINFLRLLCMVGMTCPLMQENFLWSPLKSKALQCGSIRVLGRVISPAIASWIWIILSHFLFGRECDGFLQCLVMLGPARRVFSMADSDIQISKNGLQLKLKLNQLWRTAMWLSHDWSWILTTACFSFGDNVSLSTGVRSSSLTDNFWKSLHL